MRLLLRRLKKVRVKTENTLLGYRPKTTITLLKYSGYGLYGSENGLHTGMVNSFCCPLYPKQPRLRQSSLSLLLRPLWIELRLCHFPANLGPQMSLPCCLEKHAKQSTDCRDEPVLKPYSVPSRMPTTMWWEFRNLACGRRSKSNTRTSTSLEPQLHQRATLGPNYGSPKTFHLHPLETSSVETTSESWPETHDILL